MNWKPGDHAMTVDNPAAPCCDRSWVGREVIVGDRHFGRHSHLIGGLAYWHITFVGGAPKGAIDPLASELNLVPMPPPKEEPLPTRADYIPPAVRELFEAPKQKHEKVEIASITWLVLNFLALDRMRRRP